MSFNMYIDHGMTKNNVIIVPHIIPVKQTQYVLQLQNFLSRFIFINLTLLV